MFGRKLRCAPFAPHSLVVIDKNRNEYGTHNGRPTSTQGDCRGIGRDKEGRCEQKRYQLYEPGRKNGRFGFTADHHVLRRNVDKSTQFLAWEWDSPNRLSEHYN